MKPNILRASRRTAGAGAAIAALLLLGAFTSRAQVQKPPYGTTWDCLLSGSGQQGVAFLTFSNDFTFTGWQLLVGKQSATSASGSDGRNDGGDPGRYPSSNTNSVGGGTNLFGFGPVAGPWRYDEKGRVIGYFTEILNQQTSITTNLTLTTITETTTNMITNLDGTITYSTSNIVLVATNTVYITNTSGTTNGVSFSAKVTPGKHLSLVSSTAYGKVSYNGVPQNSKALPAPISGTWYATKKENGQSTLQFFDLFPTDVQNIFMTTNGQGPGISFFGYAMVSVQKKMGFAFQTFQGTVTNFDDASGGTVSATYGGLSYPRQGAKANASGWEEPINPVTFKAQRQGP